MTLTIDVPPDMENSLRWEARQKGIEPQEAVFRLLEKHLPKPFLTARELLKLPAQEREEYLKASAEEALSLYEADIALPPEERELTAFTALDSAPFLDLEEEVI